MTETTLVKISYVDICNEVLRDFVIVQPQQAAQYHTAARSLSPLPRWDGGDNWKGKGVRTHGMR